MVLYYVLLIMISYSYYMTKQYLYKFDDMPLQPEWHVEVEYQLEDGSFDHAFGTRKETFIVIDKISIYDIKDNDITNRIKTDHYKHFEQLEMHLENEVEKMCSSEFE